MPLHNFTYWHQHLFELSMQGYTTVLGVFVWPLIFMGVIGYVYLKQQSYVAAAVATLVIISTFGNYLIGVDELMILLYLFVALAMTGLILIFLSKKREGGS